MFNNNSIQLLSIRKIAIEVVVANNQQSIVIISFHYCRSKISENCTTERPKVTATFKRKKTQNKSFHSRLKRRLCLHQHISSVFNDITFFWGPQNEQVCVCAHAATPRSRLNRLILLSAESRAMRVTYLRRAHRRTYLYHRQFTTTQRNIPTCET